MQTLAPGATSNSILSLRQTMVDCQIRTFDVTDQRLLRRFLAVPREAFVPETAHALAYSDVGLTVEPSPSSGDRRYLLPPMILARLLQGARVRSSDKVLDVGGGLGYSAAVLSGLAREVVALETPGLAEAQRANLASLGATNVQVVAGPLDAGASSDGPFDVIVVNGAVAAPIDVLAEQLAENGRLVAIWVERRGAETQSPKAMCFEKHGRDLGRRFLFDVAAPVLPGFQAKADFVF